MSKAYVTVNDDNAFLTILKNRCFAKMIRAGVTPGKKTGRCFVLGTLNGQCSTFLVKVHLDCD